MEIILYVLIDNSSRIYYSSDNETQCEEYKQKLKLDNLKVIALKGVL